MVFFKKINTTKSDIDFTEDKIKGKAGGRLLLLFIYFCLSSPVDKIVKFKLAPN